MNSKHLVWVIPICLILGFLICIFTSPHSITVDYGDNMVEVTRNLKELYNGTMKVNNSECPDCNCYLTLNTSKENK